MQQWVDEWGESSVYWRMGLRTQGALLERVKNFFRFCVRMGWIAMNPAEGIESITEGTSTTHTTPLSPSQYESLLNATQKYDADMRPDDRMGNYLRAIIEVQRWCGLRIGGVLRMERGCICDGRLRIRTKKTGEDVFVLVPEHVRKQLDALPNIGRYYFWSGVSSYKSLAVWSQR